MKINKKGFTLLELLVVIAIIGLLSTIAVTSFNSARGKARDAQRISAMKSVQTAMEFWFDENGNYDIEGTGTTPLAVSAITNFVTYIPTAASLNDPSGVTTLCVNSTVDTNGCDYSVAATSTTDYTIYFHLEKKSDAISGSSNSGSMCSLTSAGIGTCTADAS